MLRVREFIYIIIIGIITFILLALAPKPDFSPKGIYLPNPNAMVTQKSDSKTKNILPSDVSITRYPPNTEKSATINIIKHFESMTPQANKKNNLAILDLARKIAAQNGANLLLLVGVSQTPFVGPLDEIQMNFYAYKT